MNIIIRKEQEKDYKEVEEITREAFWNHHSPGCDEHYLVHIMRKSPAFVKELDYVAVDDNRIVGNIMYTETYILGDDNRRHPVLCFGPVSVLPEYQGKGVGSKLIEHTKIIAKGLGYKAVLIFGDPEFYKRVGFVSAESYSIGTSWNTYAVPLLACELEDGALAKCKGRFFEGDIYEIDKEKAEEFDENFPLKEKISGLPSQQRFSELVSMNKPRI
ncbi:N-acetyltransferase [Sedimentibacter sp.]|uniref:GNAT family N-acetyltransferase n=1 Tax=Sedimentibacter sp. TaxID=1960295 RepID=UPI0028A6A021|nr:N-acetyltransferase [Sedimentibacter sp.]